MWNTYSGSYGRRDLTVQGKKCCLLIGNSRWHWAIEKTSGWSYCHTAPDITSIQSLKIPLVAWAAVGPIPKDVFLNPLQRISLRDIPFKGLPPWLGIDRALAGWGAFKKENPSSMKSCGLLVADAGTVLSLTRITPNGEFAGGQLIAGLQLQLTAMANGTKNLMNPGPISKGPSQFPFTTAEAMQRGSLQALVGALLEAIKDTKMSLWLCGGDAPLLLEELKKQKVKVIHHPNLVLEGMVDIQNQINQDEGL